ncbi:hypothetical protein L873DRAFT_1600128, partial [Choiromyces venosus 120613-1]
KKDISNHSTWASLDKLGWNWKEVHKAIYKDVYEHSDMQEYRQNIFLPGMATFK